MEVEEDGIAHGKLTIIIITLTIIIVVNLLLIITWKN